MGRRAHREILGTAELLDLRIRITGRVDGGPDDADVDGLLELELHQRAAGELDAARDAVRGEKDQTDGDEGDRQANGDAPGLDEVVVGSVQDAQHEAPRCSASGRRASG